MIDPRDFDGLSDEEVNKMVDRAASLVLAKVDGILVNYKTPFKNLLVKDQEFFYRVMSLVSGSVITKPMTEKELKECSDSKLLIVLLRIGMLQLMSEEPKIIGMKNEEDLGN